MASLLNLIAKNSQIAMELINHTEYPALMFRSEMSDEKYAMSVAIRITYDIIDGNAITAEIQEWVLKPQTWQSQYGLMESDNVFKRGGVDILLFGSAKAPKGIPTTSMNVEVKFNNQPINKIAVFGERVWEKSILGMYISTPKSFTEMPISLENAYGGQAEWDGLSVPYNNNPYGKGYHHSKEDHVGKPLPNIELPDKLIRKWTDQPDPIGVGCLPQLCELHMRNNIEFDREGRITKFEPRFYNTAFPAMIVDKIEDNDIIEIIGMSESSFKFKIPSKKISMKVSLGERSKSWEMYIEQVGIIIDKKSAFITYRCPVNYKFVPHEIRKCEVFST
ncbi:DUF2169 domain-containing protein [soil metagenome]